MTTQTLFDDTLAILKDRLGTSFFLEGGCAVAAALLAEVAQANNDFGHLILMEQESEDGRDTWISHVTYHHIRTNQVFDINGPGADDRWIDHMTQEAEAEGEEPPCFSEDYYLDIDPDTCIRDVLWQITREHGFIQDVEWLENHYDDLRRAVLAGASQQAA
ncbi:MAG: hypothetical protein AWU57_336 [Marinobacter sp. T13-3]|nr:MAG: hypothetical protein AWU57_336 [Marinobacter sp. T13-3]